jgi:hypothetical protein
MGLTLDTEAMARNRETCRQMAVDWRKQAATLRDVGQYAYLPKPARDAMLREADAADRQAAWWEAGAVENMG